MRKTLGYRFQLVTLAMMAALGSVATSSAQFIDPATPEATAESSGSVWGTLNPQQNSTQTTQVDGDLYVLPSSGAEVVILDGAELLSEGAQVEDQIIFENEFGMGALAVIGVPGANPTQVRDSYVEGFGESMDSIEEVESDSTRKEATGIYVFESSGLPLYMYISVDGVSFDGYMVIEVFIAEPEKMADGIETARENVSVDDVEMFKDIDAQEIQDIIIRYEG